LNRRAQVWRDVVRGNLLITGIGLHNVEQIMAVTLLIVVFAAAVSSLLLHIDHRLDRRA
jgi:NitT/TauT family transport system permease protein